MQKEFISTRSDKIYCSKECREAFRYGVKIKAPKEKKKKKGMSAAEISKYAWENYRMSYGQYVAWKGL